MRHKYTSINNSNLFRLKLDHFINQCHPLYKLANSINWSVFDKNIGKLYIDKADRPSLPIRVIIGLHYLKQVFNESDETIVERLLENPYWQYFCGFEYFQHELSINSNDLDKWRRLNSLKAIHELLTVTIELAKSDRDFLAKSPKQILQVTSTESITVNPQSLLRLSQVLALIPVSRASWLAGVRNGRYPQPIKLGPRTTCWRAADILALTAGASHVEEILCQSTHSKK